MDKDLFNKKEFMRLRKNLQNRIYRLRKKGLDVSFELEKMPKNTSVFTDEYVESFREFSTQNLDPYVYKKETVVSKFYGENIPNESDFVIDNFKSMIRSFPTAAEPFLSKWLTTTISQLGKDVVARAITQAQGNGVILTREIAYDEAQLNDYVQDLLSFTDEIGEMEKSTIMDSLEGWNYE